MDGKFKINYIRKKTSMTFFIINYVTSRFLDTYFFCTKVNGYNPQYIPETRWIDPATRDEKIEIISRDNRWCVFSLYSN